MLSHTLCRPSEPRFANLSQQKMSHLEKDYKHLSPRNPIEALRHWQPPYHSDLSCPICLQTATFPVETNCGHLFCGSCLITYWKHGSWLGAINCPLCRQKLLNLWHKYFIKPRQNFLSSSDPCQRLHIILREHALLSEGEGLHVRNGPTDETWSQTKVIVTEILTGILNCSGVIFFMLQDLHRFTFGCIVLMLIFVFHGKVILLYNASCENQQDKPSKQTVRDIRDYNKRFSGQPRPFADYLYDMPLLLNLALRGIFTLGGLVWIFCLRIVVCSFGTIMCLTSRFDVMREPLCGILAAVDDLVVVFLLLICMFNICQQMESEDINMASSTTQTMLSES